MAVASGPDALHDIRGTEKALLHFRFEIRFISGSAVHKWPETAEKCDEERGGIDFPGPLVLLLRKCGPAFGKAFPVLCET
jgi:hypothetical protein